MSPLRLFLCCCSLFFASPLHSAVPQLLNHQGRMAVNGVPFEGAGQFKFALVSSNGLTTYWTNDGIAPLPATAVSLSVSKGLYAVLLGDVALLNMAALPTAALDSGDVRLRVWFNDGVNGFQQISPDQRLAAAPYALVASRVDSVLLSDIETTPAKPVLAWGSNSSGQTTVPPTLTNGNTAMICAAGSTSLALLKNGTVIQWGSGPAVPNTLTNVTHIAAGPNHRLATTFNGSIIAWGDNSSGQSTVPLAASPAKAVAAGEKHSVALLTNGAVVAWGDNSFNQTSVPFGLAAVTALSAGYDHTLALRSDGTVVAWGRNNVGQTDVPSGLNSGNNIIAIAAGAYHSLALLQNGTVVAWGWDNGGQSDVPSTLSGVVKISAGYAFSLALKADGTLIGWGENSANQLVLPSGEARFANLAAGAFHALALRPDLCAARLARLDTENVFSDKIGIRRAAAINTLEVEGQASKTTAGNWLANSDQRIKQDIVPVTGALEKLDRVRLVDFRYCPNYLKAHPSIPDTRYLNVIAQEFAEVFPDHVQSSGEKLSDGSAILQVDTYPLTIYTAAAVQELHRENTELKHQLATQEARLKKLETALSQ